MNEKLLKKQLITGILVCAILSVFSIVAGSLVLNKTQGSLKRLMQNQMQAEVIDYTDRIRKQIDKDYQTLESLAEFIHSSGLMDSETLPDILHEVNRKNEFVSMGYFNEEGIGSLVHMTREPETNVDYRVLAPQVQECMERAYQGENSLSELFQSKLLSHQIYVYCVPIIENGMVVGVLSASDYMEAFEQSLEKGAILNGNGSIYLVDDNGNIRISTGKLKKNMNLFETSISEEDQEVLKKVVAGDKEYGFVTLHEKSKSYLACMKSLGLNDWYLVCVHDNQEANSSARDIFKTLVVVFVTLVLILLALLAFVSVIMMRSTKTLMRLAYRDALTGADNMVRFEKNLLEAKEQYGHGCLVELNVRQFKFINEMFGRKAADMLLREITEQIQRELGEGEFFARENADCFYIFFLQTEEKQIEHRLSKIASNVRMQAHNENKNFPIRLYAGAYVLDNTKETLTLNVIMTRVSYAMEHCRKQSGKKWYFYDEEIHRQEEMKNYIESHMEQALKHKEFQMYLQPKMDLHKNCLGGAEALVRWKSKDKGMIFPDAFIPLFEENGFCVQLDYYMLEQVFQLLRSWMDQGMEPVPISVNQSKVVFFQPEYIGMLHGFLELYQVPPKYITLEILEGLALENVDKMRKKLQEIHELGFSISMDDFGSGYSSFNTLGNFEIDELKLDRGFLLEMSKGRAERFKEIMSNIMYLSQKLHISTVTEGVETIEDEALIREMGCDFGQGYLYSRPIPVKEFEESYMYETKQ